jgi:putative membrane protein
MFIQTLIVTSALVAGQQPQTPPRATPETRPPAQAPATGTSQAHTDHAAGATGADATFVKKAADGGMAEVSLAKLAQEKASSSDVKSFAAKLEKDHTKANDELKEVASKKGITLPTEPSKNHQAMHDRLSKLSGAEFDKAYVTAMLDDHQKDVREFQRVASGSGDPDVKAFASKTLPTLKDHLQQVQELSKNMGGAKKQTS